MPQQPPRQRQHVIGPIFQRRQVNLNDVNPVEQVLSKPPGFHGFFEVDIRRRDDPDISNAGYRIADALVLPVLQKPQKLRLQGDGQIADLAKYFSAQVPQPNVAADTRFADKGRSIFENGIPAGNVPPCSTCHGPKGYGTETFPRLAGQHADYIVKQLGVFQNTEERPEGAVMKTVAHSLTAQDMQAVAAYVQGLR